MSLMDEVKLNISAGKGGDGVVRWKREKYIARGGPGGGNGGKGGNVYAEAVQDLSYLDFYRHKKDFKAKDGDPGGNFSREGADGEDLILKFPRGSVLKNIETEEIFELKEVGEKILILKGGRGGLGNEYFKSSTNQSPEEWTPGKQAQKADFFIELQLFADIGLIGLPSVGKSTLLNSLTEAKSKVAAYHFTTLDPHLGVLPSGLVLADIPGIIEGASEGKGLGHKFLRHIKRTKTLAHLISLESEIPLEDYKVIRKELGNYDKSLLEKKEIIILTKSDMVDNNEAEEIKKEILKFTKNKNIFVISAFDDEDLKKFSDALGKILL